jgi:TIR domain
MVVDPQGPVFFLSYARSRAIRTSPEGLQNGDLLVVRFFEDLARHVDQLVGCPPGSDPGFMDRTMGGGNRWREVVLNAARACQVFVPLISPQYVTSDWCDREWETFARRRVTRRSRAVGTENSASIVPVRWLPTPQHRVPEKVRDLQFFEPQRLTDPTITQRYRDDGVYGLLTLGDEAAYQAVAWRLARHIVDTYYANWVDPAPPTESGERE